MERLHSDDAVLDGRPRRLPEYGQRSLRVLRCDSTVDIPMLLVSQHFCCDSSILRGHGLFQPPPETARLTPHQDAHTEKQQDTDNQYSQYLHTPSLGDTGRSRGWLVKTDVDYLTGPL